MKKHPIGCFFIGYSLYYCTSGTSAAGSTTSGVVVVGSVDTGVVVSSGATVVVSSVMICIY